MSDGEYSVNSQDSVATVVIGRGESESSWGKAELNVSVRQRDLSMFGFMSISFFFFTEEPLQDIQIVDVIPIIVDLTADEDVEVVEEIINLD